MFTSLDCRFRLRVVAASVAAAVTAACASAPPPPPPPAGPSIEQKVAWLLRLEDQRMLRDPAPPPPPPPPVPAQPPRKGRVVVAPAPPPVPDLIAMLSDRDAHLRRRAALAVGRV